MPTISNYRGVIPALSVPFRPDLSIDEADLRQFAAGLIRYDRVVALMTNGHTGEVFALTPKERAEVTRIVANELRGRRPVISAVVCEGISEAIEHAHMAKEAGAQGLDIMPPHHWLRFGFKPEHVIDYFSAIGKASGLDLVVHVYPAWTRASYSSELLAELARVPYVRAFKVGTRDMNKYGRDLRAIRAAAPDKALLTCHDEYLLASLVQGVDGALVGFASFIPRLIIDLLDAVEAGDLKRAMEIQFTIDPLKDLVYGGGEPTGDAHARMKAAMVMAGVIGSGVVRPPTRLPSGAEVKQIEEALGNAGLLRRNAA
ncbi:MAG: dihydrodipicolinate synthase family protein [Alphaproteobacteria bacterium]|nr:dihydrodipicolinate synthase family protein [Alphaproteobacteria bacterium]